MRVDYGCGLVRHSEWICFEHRGYARQRAVAWWQQRSASPVPATVAEALAATVGLPTPTAIRVRSNGRFIEVVKHRFDPCIDPSSARSAVASPAASAGSTRAIASATPGAMPASDSFARVFAKTFVAAGRG
jgi:DNA repair protein RadD